MPEAFTYYDMRRRIHAAIPDKERFFLQIYEGGSRYQGINEDIMKLTRKDKLKARQDNPSSFKYHVAATFPGLDVLPKEIKHGVIELSGNEVQSRGKAIGIPIGSNWWINIQLLMQGHLVVISGDELETMDSSITVQLALINEDSSKPSILVVDKIRLTILTFVHSPASIWWSRKQGPCPITEPDAFRAKFTSFSIPDKAEDSIFKILTKRQDVCNGIGTSHANEILHLAMEHPAQKAVVILGIKTRREGLMNAIRRFFDFAFSDKYIRGIPAGRSGGSAFFEPYYLTRNIISMQQRVYGHTKSPTKISKDVYDQLFTHGLLDPKYQALNTPKRGRVSRDSTYHFKRVEVYAIRFLLKNKKTGKVTDGQFAYTVMCKAPPDCVAVRYETREKALRQALGTRNAEIGIASFPDNAKTRKFEQTAFKRRFSVKTGKPGRPRKSKNAKVEASYGATPLTPADRIMTEADSPKRRKTPNKVLVSAGNAGNAGDIGLARELSADSVPDTYLLDSGDSDDTDEVSPDADGIDEEDAVSVLDQAFLLDEARSGDEDVEVVTFLEDNGHFSNSDDS